MPTKRLTRQHHVLPKDGLLELDTDNILTIPTKRLTRQHHVLPEDGVLVLDAEGHQVRFQPGNISENPEASVEKSVEEGSEAHDAVWVTREDVVPAGVKVAGLDEVDGEVVAVVVPDPPSPHRVPFPPALTRSSYVTC